MVYMQYTINKGDISKNVIIYTSANHNIFSSDVIEIIALKNK